MKATIEFNLPDDEEALKNALAATDIVSDLLVIRNQVRLRLKHGPEPDREFVEHVYEQLLEILPYE